jgi:mRNA interferase MazF
MRAIHVVLLDKSRPAVILTREVALGVLTNTTVAPITSRIRGIGTEVAVGARNGLDHTSVISCDNVQTVPSSRVGTLIGYLHEDALRTAIHAAFDLDD